VDQPLGHVATQGSQGARGKGGRQFGEGALRILRQQHQQGVPRGCAVGCAAVGQLDGAGAQLGDVADAEKAHCAQHVDRDARVRGHAKWSNLATIERCSPSPTEVEGVESGNRRCGGVGTCEIV